MKPEIKKLWIEALRSGEYRQCRSQLKYEDSAAPRHCCLGVLQEIAKAEGVIADYDPMGLVLDGEVVTWAGLEENDPRFGNEGTATALNDGGESFDFIATRIEKYL